MWTFLKAHLRITERVCSSALELMICKRGWYTTEKWYANIGKNGFSLWMLSLLQETSVFLILSPKCQSLVTCEMNLSGKHRIWVEALVELTVQFMFICLTLYSFFKCCVSKKILWSLSIYSPCYSVHKYGCR